MPSLRTPAILVAVVLAAPVVAADPAPGSPDADGPIVTAAPAEGSERTIAALQALADADATTPLDLAWRDRANVVLGYWLLDRKQGEAAIARFDQVRSPGPFANAALLGRGWAFLVPHGGEPDASLGSAASRALLAADADAVAVVRRAVPFRYASAIAGGARADDLRRALVPWSELTGRDPLDAAVQEGMLAIAYALSHLGARQQAVDHSQRAVDLLEGLLAILQQARAHAASDAFAADALQADGDPARSTAPLRWWRSEFADLPPTFYLEPLSHADAYRLALAAYRAQPEGERLQALQRTALDELDRLVRQATRYLAEAHYQLARLHDAVVAAAP